MVYLQEAHADDLWPLGYGISSHATLHDRISACSKFLEDHREFCELLHGVALDAMDDRFLHTFGAWPERYFLADLSGKVLWASSTQDVQDQDGSREGSPIQEVLHRINAESPRQFSQ
mmetsp:Transcript_16460/g.34412  ORF Transcript_16460/g.34412 Transcript_16460/m.34412 type:complete len:117 (+) Transcript_16460:938-1288(+)